MSTRAVRTEIALQGLDPRLPHNKVDKKGRLVPHGAGPGPVEVIEEPAAVVEEPKVKSALVQLEPEETKVETTEVVTEVVEETKQDAAESEETPKKKPGKKEKKVVSTDL